MIRTALVCLIFSVAVVMVTLVINHVIDYELLKGLLPRRIDIPGVGTVPIGDAIK